MRFSVIVTVFEREELVPRILDSLQQQTYRNWEAIFVADGHHPDAEECVLSFNRNVGGRLRYETLPRAVGTYGNVSRRVGMARATGDYLCFIGHDCLLHPTYLETHAENAKVEGALSLVQCRYWTNREHQGKNRRVCRYVGIIPSSDKPPQNLGIGEVDLTCMAFPMAAAQQAKVFRSAWDKHYAADWFSYEACLKIGTPVSFADKVVATHF